MTAQEEKLRKGLNVYRQVAVTVTKERNEAQTKLRGAIRLGSYYCMRYHDTRGALIACRLDILGLESMVESLQKRLGDKGLDIGLASDNLDVA